MSTPAAPTPPNTAPAAPSPLTLSGKLRNAATGYPLSGLLVQALYVQPPPAPGAKPPAPRVIGSAHSDAAGAWNIVWNAGPAVSQLVCLLASCTEAQYVVSVSDPTRATPLLVTAPASVTRGSIVLDLAVPIATKPLTRKQWSDLAQRVQKAGPVTLNTLVGQLAQTGGSAPLFSDWPLAQRQSALGALEAAFLDPRHTLGAIAPVPSWQTLAAPGGLDVYRATLKSAGKRKAAVAALNEMAQKLAAFPALSAVDWLIQPTLLSRNVAGAITAYQGQYQSPLPKRWPWPVAPAPELGYRDYLRTQWTSMITLVEYVQPHALTEAQAEQQLRNRFHQDFTVTDTTQGPANEIDRKSVV